MNRLIRTILSALLGWGLCLALPAGLMAEPKAISPKDFAYKAALDAPLQADSLYVLPLGPEILERANRSLGDVRLFDSLGRPVGLVILKNSRPASPAKWTQLKLESLAEEDKLSNILLSKPQDTGALYALRLDVTGRDFKLEAEVLSSQDKINWTRLAKGELYDSASVKLSKLEFEFPACSDQYFLLRLSKPEDETQAVQRRTLEGTELETVRRGHWLPFRLNSVQAMTAPRREAQNNKNELRIQDFTSTSQAGKTVMEFKCGLPLEELRIETNEPFFERRISLWAYDEPPFTREKPLTPVELTGGKNKFRLLTEGILKKNAMFEANSAQNALEFPAAKHDLWRIVIEDKDSQPLKPSALLASWSEPLAFFIAQDSGGYQLCLGNPKLAPVEIDLGRKITQGNWWNLSALPASIGPLTANPEATGPSLFDEPPTWLLSAFILVLCLGLWLWIARLLRDANQSNKK